MDYWSGKRKIKIPKLGFGTWQMKGKQCVDAVSRALQTGYRHIDTAQIYGNEAEVGQALSSSGIARKDIFWSPRFGGIFWTSGSSSSVSAEV